MRVRGRHHAPVSSITNMPETLDLSWYVSWIPLFAAMLRVRKRFMRETSVYPVKRRLQLHVLRVNYTLYHTPFPSRTALYRLRTRTPIHHSRTSLENIQSAHLPSPLDARDIEIQHHNTGTRFRASKSECRTLVLRCTPRPRRSSSGPDELRDDDAEAGPSRCRRPATPPPGGRVRCGCAGFLHTASHQVP